MRSEFNPFAGRQTVGWNFSALAGSVIILLIAYFNCEINVKILTAWVVLGSLLAYVWPRMLPSCLAAWRFLPLLTALCACYVVHANHEARARQVSLELTDVPVWVRGEVADIPVVNLSGKRFLLDVVCVGKVPQSCTPANIKKLSITWQDAPALSPGDMLLLPIKLRPMQNQERARFDLMAWAKQARIDGQGRVLVRKTPQKLASDWSLNRLRAHVAARLNQHLDSHEPISQLFPALVIGARSSLSDEQWRIMNLSGTTHLFSISGMHVTFLASCLYAAGLVLMRRWRWLTLRWSAQNATALLAYAAALGYGFMAGMSIPTLRTLVMLAVLLLAKLSQRHIGGIRLFLTTLLGVLLVDPFAGLSTGFWLSFLAVGLLIWVERTSSVWAWLHAVSTQWWISIGMIPITLYYFKVLPLFAFFANLIAIPVVGAVVVPLALVASVIMFVHAPTAQLLFDLAAVLLSLCWRYLSWITQLPFSAFEQVQLPLVGFLLILLGISLMLVPRALGLLPVALICIALPWWHEPEGIPVGQARVAVFGGDDQTLVLRTRQQVMLIKNGEVSKSLQTYLEHAAIRQVNYWYAPTFAMPDKSDRYTRETKQLTANFEAGSPCPQSMQMDEVEIEFRALAGADRTCVIAIKSKQEVLLFVPNSLKKGLLDIPLEGIETLLAPARLLPYLEGARALPKRILVTSRASKRKASMASTGVSIEWIYGKETELLLN